MIYQDLSGLLEHTVQQGHPIKNCRRKSGVREDFYAIGSLM